MNFESLSFVFGKLNAKNCASQDFQQFGLIAIQFQQLAERFANKVVFFNGWPHITFLIAIFMVLYFWGDSLLYTLKIMWRSWAPSSIITLCLLFLSCCTPHMCLLTLHHSSGSLQQHQLELCQHFVAHSPLIGLPLEANIWENMILL